MLEVQAVKRALQILELFTVKRVELGVTDVSRELRLNKSTVARLMFTLKESGFLIGFENDGRYRLGWKVSSLGSIFLSSVKFRETALPHMKQLRNNINETIDLCVLNDDKRVCIERLESNYDVRPIGAVGGQSPLHAGASGKLLLAYMSKDKQAEFFENNKNLQVLTPNTITDKEKLLEEIARILELGYATSHQERVALVNAVAAPVRNHRGEVVAVLSVSGLVNSFTDERMEETLIPQAIETATKISQELGYDNGL
ncbi:IclR family transcriptional regulator [Chloroflexota bacterium]